MQSVQNIRANNLREGAYNTISWDGVYNASSYDLYRKLDTDSDIKLIGSTADTQYSDYIPLNTQYVTYGVRANRLAKYIWYDIDQLTQARKWEALDQLEWTWEQVKHGFDDTWDEVAEKDRDFDYLDSLDWQWEYRQSEITYVFFEVGDIISTSSNYLLRDGVPVQRIDGTVGDGEFVDYSAAGTHTYVVRNVDKYGTFTDSNQVEITVNVEPATIAQVDSPQEFTTLLLRRGEYPSVSNDIQVNSEPIFYEGRSRPVVPEAGEITTTWNISYTHTDDQSYNSIKAMRGKTVLFRYQKERVIGVLESSGNTFHFPVGRFQRVTDHNEQIIETDYTEEIQYD